MRKLMVAVAAVAGLAFAAGCKRNEVQQERRELAEAQQEAQGELAEIQREARQETAEVQQEVAEERQELAKAQQERAQDLREGSAGSAATSTTIQGRVQSTTGDSLVLILPADNNRELKLKTDDQTRVTQNNQPVKLDDFEEGTEVRASFVLEGDDMVARDVVIIHPVKQK